MRDAQRDCPRDSALDDGCWALPCDGDRRTGPRRGRLGGTPQPPGWLKVSVSTLSGKRELHFEGDTVLMRKPFARQLSLPLDLDEVVPVPAEKQKEVEQVLADLLLSAAGADAEEGRRNPS